MMLLHLRRPFITLLIFALLSPWTVVGQEAACSTTLIPSGSARPSVASGYQMALVATGLTEPRSIAFDTSGNLMVVESGAGITNLVLQDNGGICLSVTDRKPVIRNSGVSTNVLL